MRARVLGALAAADFRERTRRPAYLVTLASAVVLGYLALPPASSLFAIMNAGGYRSVYNSAYAGTATALAGALWLMGGGFYVVRSAIARDQQTGVGQILAATPLHSAAYLAGKFFSNLMVLASMAGVLAVTALALQLARGESMAVDPGALLLPYVLFTLPVLALTAAAAVLLETIPVLRGGLGNIAWFFLWMIFAIAGAGVPLGFGAVTTSMREAMAAQHLKPGEFSVGFTKLDHPLHTFTWHGLEPSGGFVAARLVLILAAACLAVLPAVWFGRFDPARARPRGAPAPDSGQTPVPVPATADAASQAARSPRSLAYRPLSPATARPGLAFGRLLAGEVRILVQGTSRWWWLVAATVNAASLAVPASLVKPAGASTALLLSAAWIWPVLIWSRLGAQRHENGLETLLGAYPAVYRQLAAEWAAGLALTAVAGLGPLLRMTVTADGPRVAAWIAGALFIPSLALLLGTASRTHRMFQASYLILWYAAVNQLAAADYMGTVLAGGRPAGPPPLVIAGLALAMLTLTFVIRSARHARR
jgi:ABC-type transport system involved in multi-copper enzyme maturation permease subunit